MGKKNSKLKPRALADLIEHTEFTRDEIKQWYRGFKNDFHKGYITVEEFKEVYNNFYPEGDASSFAEHTFRVFDSNHDGKIDFREFVIGFSISSRGSVDEKLKWLFEFYDTDSNGYISKDEMLVIVKSVYKMVVNTSSNTCDDSLAVKSVDKMYEKVDKNLDGLLSLEEFIELGKTDPTLSNVLTGDMATY